MADANVRALQATLNRYAPIAGFAQIGVDGIMGPITASGVLKSLAWVAGADSSETDTAASLSLHLINDDGTYNYDQLNQSASGFNTYLSDEADSLRVKAGQPVVAITSGGGGGQVVPNLPGPKTPTNVGANLAATIKNLPLWAKIAGGVAVGIGGIALHSHMKKRHGGLKGFFGFAR